MSRVRPDLRKKSDIGDLSKVLNMAKTFVPTRVILKHLRSHDSLHKQFIEDVLTKDVDIKEHALKLYGFDVDQNQLIFESICFVEDLLLDAVKQKHTNLTPIAMMVFPLMRDGFYNAVKEDSESYSDEYVYSNQTGSSLKDL